MNSLPTIEQINYLTFIQKYDPEIYMIKLALDETGVNPLIMIPIIRAISNLTYDGWGKVQIFMQARVITQIKPEASTEVNEPAKK
jgi:hypothetical protein